MRVGHVCSFIALTIALAGCGKQNSTAPTTTEPAAHSTAPSVATTTPSIATQEKSAAAESDKPSKGARLNGDGSETGEDVNADTGAHNPLLAAVASTVVAATPTAGAATLTGPTLWQEGANYTRLVPAQPTDVPSGQVEVLEFFWYACPHCAALDPSVEAWLKTKPSYVTFNRVHVLWSDSHRNLARLYYTLKVMNRMDLNSAVFKEIHVNGNSLLGPDPNNPPAAEQVQTAFAKQHGISEEEFKKNYHSMTVDALLQRADELVQRYRVGAVPTFVVNGKYIADVGTAGSADRLISLIGDLAAAEHKH